MFEGKKFDKIRNILELVLNSPYSDFYRKKYQEAKVNIRPEDIRTYEDFQKIPFLTKEEILAVPLSERMFIPEEEVRNFSFTSGTVSKSLIMPHRYDDTELIIAAYNEPLLKKLKVRNVFSLLPPLSSFASKVMSIPKEDTVIIPGDAKNLNLSARIAKQIGVECIFTTPTILYFFTSCLDKIDFERKSIKFIVLSGEFITKERLKYFQEKFPNARVLNRYAATEIGGPIGRRCDYLQNQDSTNSYHMPPNGFIEIIKDGKPVTKEFGEIVYTNENQDVFPLIRYRFSDMGKLTKQKCRCGQDYMLEIGGRFNYDFFRFHGFFFHTQAVEESLGEVRHMLEPGFELHIYEKLKDKKIQVQLLLKVVLKDKKNSNSLLIKKLIQESVTNRLNVAFASKKPLSFYVKNNIFLPLEVETLEAWPIQTKSKNIIPHLH